jgi:RNA polymerase sigma-70 factor (ECF subfamily)
LGPSDADLVQRCLQGDNAGFDQLVKKYQRQVYGLCYRMLGDADEAADAAQESFVKAYNALPSFRQDAQFLTWVFRIANNACIDASRRRSTRKADSLDEMMEVAPEIPSDGPSPEESAIKKHEAERVREAILRVPERYRAALVMFYMNGLTIREISKALGRPEGTVKSDLHNAREILRRKLEGVVVEV